MYQILSYIPIIQNEEFGYLHGKATPFNKLCKTMKEVDIIRNEISESITKKNKNTSITILFTFKELNI